MVKSGIRPALQESIPIGYLPARAKYIHNTGCQVGGKESTAKLKQEAPTELKKMSDKIMKYYAKKKKGNTTRNIPSKKTSKKSKAKEVQKGGGSLTQTLTKPALSAVIVLLALNQLGRSYSKYKLKGGSSKRTQKNQVEKYKKMLCTMKKESLVKMADVLMALAPMKPSDARYPQLTSLITAKHLKQAGGLRLNINNATVATLLFLLQQVIDKKWGGQRGGSKKRKTGCGCGPSNKVLYSELDRIIMGMHGGSHVNPETVTGCMQPDWCAFCI